MKKETGRSPTNLACSVVVIARNAEATLEACLRSIKKQSRYPDEIIVVDNGSTDSTSKVATRMEVRVISEPRRGRARARNAGIKAARGDLIVFIDSDAVADESWLVNLLKYQGLEDERVAGVAGNILASNRQKRIPRLLDLVVANCPHYGTGNILYFKRVLEETGGFDERLGAAEDVELAWRIIRRGYTLGFEPRAVVYHNHPERLYSFVRQQFNFGRWSIFAREISQMPRLKTKLLIPFAPLTFFKHLPQARKHPLLPILLTSASISYALGTLTGLLRGPPDLP
ncbi:MAG: glycosyltransferase [Candidatus Bathyarchaeia archaeon]